MASDPEVYRKIKAKDEAAAEKKKGKVPGRGTSGSRIVQEESKCESENEEEDQESEE